MHLFQRHYNSKQLGCQSNWELFLLSTQVRSKKEQSHLPLVVEIYDMGVKSPSSPHTLCAQSSPRPGLSLLTGNLSSSKSFRRSLAPAASSVNDGVFLLCLVKHNDSE